MNITHLEHTIIALIFQGLLWPFVGRWVAGSLVVAIFLGREIAQHEYAGGGPNEVWYLYGLFNHWTLDSFLDVAAPAAACCFIALIMPGGGLWKYVRARR